MALLKEVPGFGFAQLYYVLLKRTLLYRYFQVSFFPAQDVFLLLHVLLR